MRGKYGLIVVGTLCVILGAAVRMEGAHHHGVDLRPAVAPQTPELERTGFDRLTVV